MEGRVDAVISDRLLALDAIKKGGFDGIFGSMAITDERLKVVDFTKPYYFSGAQLIVKEGSNIEGLESLGEKRIIIFKRNNLLIKVVSKGLLEGNKFEL